MTILGTAVPLRSVLSSLNNEGIYSYSSDYYVYSDTLTESPANVFNAPGIPIFGTQFNWFGDIDAWAFMDGATTSEPTGAVFEFGGTTYPDAAQFTVNVTHSNRPATRCRDNQFQDPLLEPPAFSGTFIKRKRLETADFLNQPYRATTGEWFPEGLREQTHNNPTVTVEFNQLNLNLNLPTQYVAKRGTNIATWWGLDPKKIMLTNFGWRSLLFGTCSYYFRLRYDFEIEWDTTWDLPIPNMGFHELKSGGDPMNPGDYVRILDERGHPISVPALLDANSVQIGPTAAPHIITFQPHTPFDFNILGIPPALPT